MGRYNCYHEAAEDTFACLPDTLCCQSHALIPTWYVMLPADILFLRSRMLMVLRGTPRPPGSVVT